MASSGIEVYIKLTTGKTTRLTASPGDKVEKLYQHVATEEGVSSDRVLLKYTGKVLRRTHTLGYLGVRSETILKAEIITVKVVNVYLKLSSGCSERVQVDNISPVRVLFDHAADLTGVEINRLTLKASGVAITDRTLKVMDYNITDESVVHVEVKEVTSDTAVKTRASSDSTRQEDLSELEKDAILSTFASNANCVEVVFSFDTTGSMSACLNTVRTKLREMVTRLLQDIPAIRIGIIAHGDYCDQSTYVVKMKDLTSDVDSLVSFVSEVPSTGGGDAPEAYEWVLRKAQQLDWSEDSAKALVMIGDCEPHEVSYTDQAINWHDELDVLCGMGIKVYGVKALQNNDSVEFYRELSERSGGAYITLNNIKIITDMFLAVCYREADPEQLDHFCEEVEQEGRFTEETKELFTQIKESSKPTEQRPKRYIATAWWDPALAKSRSPQYVYSPETDMWKPATQEESYTASPTRVIHSSITLSPKKKKKGCTVM